MSKNNASRTVAIRMVLADAEDSLSKDEIREAMNARGLGHHVGNLGYVLRMREEAGEFIRNTVDEVERWTIDPSYVRKVKGQRKLAAAPTAAPALAVLAPGLGMAANVQVATAEGPLSESELRALADSIDIVPLASARPLEGGLPTSVAKDPVGLIERLAAISSDIEDAIGDACDEQLPHGVIKGLVVANGAIARSVRSLQA